jgi:hypothetical protein
MPHAGFLTAPRRISIDLTQILMLSVISSTDQGGGKRRGLGMGSHELITRVPALTGRYEFLSFFDACVNSSHGSRDQWPLARHVRDHW